MLDTVVVIICILLLLIGVYSMLDNMWLYQNASDETLLSYKPGLDAPLGDRVISDKQKAWLYIENTNIDYPVMQGEDNFEFLNMDPYGEFSLSGAIFLDYRCSGDLTDEYSLIYGHHMEHGKMFGALDDFKDRGYFDAHRSGKVVTVNKVYDFEIFAVCAADGTDSTLFNPQGRLTSEIRQYLEENAMIYIEPDEGKNIFALSTCSGDTFTARLLVFGTLTEK